MSGFVFRKTCINTVLCKCVGLCDGSLFLLNIVFCVGFLTLKFNN